MFSLWSCSLPTLHVTASLFDCCVFGLNGFSLSPFFLVHHDAPQGVSVLLYFYDFLPSVKALGSSLR